jgi:hypothetical protein
MVFCQASASTFHISSIINVDAIYVTFVPAFLPYPPIIHTATNTVVFMLVAPALIVAMRALPPQWRASGQRSKPVKGKALK